MLCHVFVVLKNKNCCIILNRVSAPHEVGCQFSNFYNFNGTCSFMPGQYSEEFFLFRRINHTNHFMSVIMTFQGFTKPFTSARFNFTCFHPPGQPPGQVQPFGPRGRWIVWSGLVPGVGGQANRKKKIVLLVYVTFRFNFGAGPLGENSIFPRKSPEFVECCLYHRWNVFWGVILHCLQSLVLLWV